MDKKYKIMCPHNGKDPVETPDDWFRMHFVMLSVAKRMSGKTLSMTQFLHILHRMGKLDRLILVSGTYGNNTSYFKGLPLDPMDIIEPGLFAADRVMEILEQEALDYDTYHEKMKLWRELQRLLKSNINIDEYDDDNLIRLIDYEEKPKHRWGGRKPVVVCMFDDCQNTPAFSTKSKVSYLTIKHRHLGLTKTDGAIGCSLMYACQNYTSASGGIPKTIRGNTTILCIFKNKNQKELDLIAEECSGEVDSKQFLELHARATSEPFGFLTCDFAPKRTHPSMFRSAWNEWLYSHQ